MRGLLHPMEGPPGGWKFFQKETGVTIAGPTYADLESRLIEHRQANNIAVGLNIRQEIEQQICAKLDENHCRDSERPMHAQGSKLSISQVFTGTVTLAHWLAGGGVRVGVSEANRRAEICSTCQFNQPFDGCQGCHSNKLHELVNSIVNGEKTAYDDKLQACSLCGCSLKAKVAMPLNVLQQHLPGDIKSALPLHCWLK